MKWPKLQGTSKEYKPIFSFSWGGELFVSVLPVCPPDPPPFFLCIHQFAHFSFFICLYFSPYIPMSLHPSLQKLMGIDFKLFLSLFGKGGGGAATPGLLWIVLKVEIWFSIMKISKTPASHGWGSFKRSLSRPNPQPSTLRRFKPGGLYISINT